ncbi:MAG: AbrB/MazE/SpoVT family DNA-binding domain-containing protein [Patescibacteria group bacterium]
MNPHAMPNFYGAVTVGERGQVVIPQAAREALKIKPGDKMLVLSGAMGDHGLMMLKAEAVSEFLAHFTEKMNSLERLVKMATTEQDKD